MNRRPCSRSTKVATSSTITNDADGSNIASTVARPDDVPHRTYDVVAKDCLPEIINTYPIAIVCNTHDADQPGEHWIAMYVDAERRGDYFDPYGRQPQHVEFTNFMNEHCSEWVPNDCTQQSPLSTVCGQYCIAFLLFRCRNVSMHVFTHRLFTTDLVANDCRVFDWVAVYRLRSILYRFLVVSLP